MLTIVSREAALGMRARNASLHSIRENHILRKSYIEKIIFSPDSTYTMAECSDICAPHKFNIVSFNRFLIVKALVGAFSAL